MTIPFTLTNDNISVVLDGAIHVVRKGAANFDALKRAIMSGDWKKVPNLITVEKTVADFVKGKFTSSGSTISYNGEALPDSLIKRIESIVAEGKSPEPLFRFWERLQKNPSFRSVQQLYPFIEHEGIPFTEDGCFLAYKGVNDDFTDKHTSKVDNSPGKKHEMPRNKISDDPNTACHFGFHVGALDYAKSFAAKVVICKVDPENVVCVPYDAAQQKMRVCKYEVIGLWNNEQPMPSTYIDSSSMPDDDDSDEDIDESPVVSDSDEPKHDNKPKRGRKRWGKYDRMTIAELMNVPIDELRQYATHGLKMVGASKIPGGKVSLISAIIKVRQ